MGILHSVMNVLILIISISIIICSVAVGVMVTPQKRNKKVTNKKIEEYVRKYSTRYSQLLDLNLTVHFKNIEKAKCLDAVCSTMRELDNFDADKYILYSLLYYGLDNVIEDFYYQAKFNQKLYQLYMEKVSAIPPTDIEYIKQKVTPDVASFHSIENSLCINAVMEPPIDPVLIVKARYTSPKGRNSHVKTQTYSIDQLEQIIHSAKSRAAEDETRQKTIQLLTDNCYYTKNYYDAYKNHQRSLMTHKMRYEVLKRDHFRCTICGASADEGAKLEVDHIKPISKGGRTEPSNLRTLCRSCNRGKRDRYDPLGVN